MTTRLRFYRSGADIWPEVAISVTPSERVWNISQRISPNPICRLGFLKSVLTRNKAFCRSDQTALRC
ncbi:hypothetical protein KCP78_24690 [Salmonella enterica subsp. enterica]|nr:hypothetical protein KCP78_24690 [Salmonella enterica subsp. enterica]